MIAGILKDVQRAGVAAAPPSKRLRLVLAASSGLLFAAAFPPIPTGLSAYVALLPFLFLMDEMESWTDVFRWSYITFLFGLAGTLWWISGWWGDDPWLMAAGVGVILFWPLTFTLPALLHYIVRRRLGSLAAAGAFPVLWTAWEWLSHLPELSFPWILLANTQTYDLVNIQFIEWTGAFGLSFWVATINAILFVMTREAISGNWKLRSKRMIGTAALLLAVLILPKVYSGIVMNEKAPAQDELTVGIIQPNIDPYKKWGTGESPLQKLQSLLGIYDSLARFNPDIMLLPETAIPFRILQPSYADEWRWFRMHIDSVGIPLLTGFPHTVWYDSPDTAPTSARRVPDTEYRYHDFNSALLLEPGEMVPQIYHKSRLTPLSERIPYLDALPFLQETLTWGVGISNWGQGNDTTVFQVRKEHDDLGLWAMICYETLYPSFVAGFAERGANVFAVITNDGWFGPSSGPYQLQQYTVLRAVENRRAVARCANNGVSCFIDPYGRVTQKTTLYTRIGIIGTIPIIREQTFYSRHGDWFPFGVSVLAAFIMLFVIIAGYYRR